MRGETYGDARRRRDTATRPRVPRGSTRSLHETAARSTGRPTRTRPTTSRCAAIGWDNVVIIDAEHDKTLAEIDWRGAHTMVHEQAIYQHDGECWQVEKFDYENHKAFVRKVEARLLHRRDDLHDRERPRGVRHRPATRRQRVIDRRRPWPTGWGEVSVVEKVVGYKKIKFYTHENAGYGDVRLPEMQMHTTAFWLTVPESVCAQIPAGARRGDRRAARRRASRSRRSRRSRSCAIRATSAARSATPRSTRRAPLPRRGRGGAGADPAQGSGRSRAGLQPDPLPLRAHARRHRARRADLRAARGAPRARAPARRRVSVRVRLSRVRRCERGPRRAAFAAARRGERLAARAGQ